MKQAFAFVILFLAGGVTTAKATSLFYTTELNLRSGVHSFQLEEQWLLSQEGVVNEEIFFRQRDSFTSRNVDTSMSSGNALWPYLASELVVGWRLGSFRGLRSGMGMTVYPRGGSSRLAYEGEIIYQDPNNADNTLKTQRYQGTLSVEDRLMQVMPTMALYYYHENGVIFTRGRHQLVPYAGIQLGLSFLSGKRKYLLDTDALASSHQVKASIQENFFNETSLQIAPTIGLQWHVLGPAFLDVRASYIMQQSDVEYDRLGSVSQSTTDSLTDEAITSRTGNSKFSQTGFALAVGLSLRLY